MSGPGLSMQGKLADASSVGREYLLRRNQQDIAEFRERLFRLADDLTRWLAGRGVSITLREGAPARAPEATWTAPVIVLRHGRNYAGFTPQALYSVKGDVQLKGDVCLAVDNPGRSPRTDKYQLYMAGHLLSTADWAIYNAGRSPGKGRVLTREQALVVLSPLFDFTVRREQM